MQPNGGPFARPFVTTRRCARFNSLQCTHTRSRDVSGLSAFPPQPCMRGRVCTGRDTPSRFCLSVSLNLRGRRTENLIYVDESSKRACPMILLFGRGAERAICLGARVLLSPIVL